MLLPFVLVLIPPAFASDPTGRYVNAVFERPTFASRRESYAAAVRAGQVSVRERAPGRKSIWISRPSDAHPHDQGSQDQGSGTRGSDRPESLFEFDFHPEGWLEFFRARDVRLSGDFYTMERPATASDSAASASTSEI